MHSADLGEGTGYANSQTTETVGNETVQGVWKLKERLWDRVMT